MYRRVCRHGLCKRRQASVTLAELCTCPAQARCSPPKGDGQSVLSAESDDGFRGVQCGVGIAAKHFEQGLELIDLRRGRGMTRFNRTRDRLIDQRARPFDLAELPTRVGEIGGRAGAGIHAETKLSLAITLVDRTFAAPARDSLATG